MIEMLSTKLRLLREFHGYTQKQVAEMLQVDRSTVSYYEAGKSSPPCDNLIRLCQFYQESTDWLLGVSDRIRDRQFEKFYRANIQKPSP